MYEDSTHLHGNATTVVRTVSGGQRDQDGQDLAHEEEEELDRF
jgi:hypothetical protein